MKFQVTQKNLNECLKNVSLFADKGHQLDIIKNIKLTTSGNLLEVSATNLSISIVERVAGSCQKEGSITVPAGLFRDYVQNLPSNEKIQLSLEEKRLTVKCGSTKATLNGIDAAKYPIFPTNNRKRALVEIEAADLRNQLNKVVLAANKDVNRPILTGVYLHTFEGGYYLAATDSYRLAEVKMSGFIKKQAAKDNQAKILIPAAAFNSLERILASQPARKLAVYHETEEKNILFVLGDNEIEITASLIEGVYPDYRKLLPDKFTTEITVEYTALMDAVKRANLFSQEASHPVVLDWSEKDALQLKSNTSQIGNNEESIPAEIKTKANQDTNIILNAKFLQEALQVIDATHIKLNLNSQLQPCLLQECRPDKKPNPDYRHAIMPLKP